MVSFEPNCLHDPQKSGSVDLQMSSAASQAQEHVGSWFIEDAENYSPALRREPIDKQTWSIASRCCVVFRAHISLLTLDPPSYTVSLRLLRHARSPTVNRQA